MTNPIPSSYKDKLTSVGTLIPYSERELLGKLHRLTGMSLSSMMRIAIHEYIDRNYQTIVESTRVCGECLIWRMSVKDQDRSKSAFCRIVGEQRTRTNRQCTQFIDRNSSSICAFCENWHGNLNSLVLRTEALNQNKPCKCSAKEDTMTVGSDTCQLFKRIESYYDKNIDDYSRHAHVALRKFLQLNPQVHIIGDITQQVHADIERIYNLATSDDNIKIVEDNYTYSRTKIQWEGYAPYLVVKKFFEWRREHNFVSEDRWMRAIASKVFTMYHPEGLATMHPDDVYMAIREERPLCANNRSIVRNVVRTSIIFSQEILGDPTKWWEL